MSDPAAQLPSHNTDENGQSLPKWKVRRKFIIVILAFCVGLISCLAVWGQADSRLHSDMVMWSFITIISIITAYVGGAVIDDKNVMSLMSAFGKKK